MSLENLQLFLTAIESDPALREKARAAAASTDPGEALSQIAAGENLSVTPGEFRAHAAGQLSEEQLDAVSGGNMSIRNPKSPFDP
jgi:predicted ribosomally synthesized peptide with nif11-like leader